MRYRDHKVPWVQDIPESHRDLVSFLLWTRRRQDHIGGQCTHCADTTPRCSHYPQLSWQEGGAFVPFRLTEAPRQFAAFFHFVSRLMNLVGASGGVELLVQVVLTPCQIMPCQGCFILAPEAHGSTRRLPEAASPANAKLWGPPSPPSLAPPLCLMYRLRGKAQPFHCGQRTILWADQSDGSCLRHPAVKV